MFLGKFVGNKFAQNVMPERICVARFNCMLKNIKRLLRRKLDPVIQNRSKTKNSLRHYILRKCVAHTFS